MVLTTFCLLPTDGAWTLQEREHGIDINVLFADEHFPDTLWMLISCDKFFDGVWELDMNGGGSF